MENQQHASVMSVKEWVITFIISFIPLIGFIMLFVWAFGSGTNANKANWAKAALIMMVIATVFYIILFAMFGAAFMGAMSSMGG